MTIAIAIVGAFALACIFLMFLVVWGGGQEMETYFTVVAFLLTIALFVLALVKH